MLKKKKRTLNRKLSDAEQEMQQIVHKREVDCEILYEGNKVYGLYIDGDLSETGSWEDLILKYEELKGID